MTKLRSVPSLAADLTARGVAALKPDESRALALAMRDPDPEKAKDARARLIEGNLPLAFWAARKFVGQHGVVNGSDCYSDAYTGLIRAADKYDPDRPEQFGTYAYHWIRQWLLRQNRLRRWIVHVPLDLDYSANAGRPEYAPHIARAKAPTADAEILAIVPDPRADAADAEADSERRAFRVAWLKGAIGGLPPEMRSVTRLYLGLDDGRAQTSREVADRLGKRRHSVYQQASEGVRRLRAMAIEEGLAC